MDHVCGVARGGGEKYEKNERTVIEGEFSRSLGWLVGSALSFKVKIPFEQNVSAAKHDFQIFFLCYWSGF